MDLFFAGLPPEIFALSCAIALIAGMVKGMVGFAMPMVLVSGLSSFIEPELALAGLLLPTLLSNLWQAMRGGWRAAFDVIGDWWVFLLVGYAVMASVAQIVLSVPQSWLLLGIGLLVMSFAAMQLFGMSLTLAARSWRSDAAVALVAGVTGGIAAIWGPPTVLYLTALGTEKRESLRVQGVIYGFGAVILVSSHLWSGLLNAATGAFSLGLLGPALLGMWIGFKVHDRVDQATFRRATLLVLLIAGANLIRRGLS